MEQVHVLPYIENQPYGDASNKPRYTFPYKLWMILNEPATRDRLVWWSDNGLEVVADPDRFEQFVMSRYPEFVRIPSFANFRRQMRWYSFTWEIDDIGTFHFKNADFQRGREDLLAKVISKRSTGRSPKRHHDGQIVTRKYNKYRKSNEYEPDYSDNSCASDMFAKSNSDVNNSSEGFKRNRSSCSVATQTAFTMSPFNTEFIGTVNDGAHYYDFYSMDYNAQAYSGFYPTYNGLPQYCDLPSPQSVSPVSEPQNGNANVFPAFQGGESMASPEHLCLQGFQKPVLMENQSHNKLADNTAPSSVCNDEDKENFTNL